MEDVYNVLIFGDSIYYILYFQSSDQDKTFKPNAYKFGQKVELSKPI